MVCSIMSYVHIFIYIGFSIDISKYIGKRHKQHLFKAEAHSSHFITSGDILITELK